MDLSFKQPPARALSRKTQSPISDVSVSGSQGSGNLNDLFNKMKDMSPARTVNTTQTNTQNRSQALEEAMNSFAQQFNTLAQNTQSAYQSQMGTYDDLIRSLADRYNVQGSAATSNAINTAIASGLSPVEAQMIGQEQLQKVMQDYNPAEAQLLHQQAGVGTELQRRLAELTQGIQMPFLGNIQTPYLRDVAGQVQTGQTVDSDPMRKMGMLANLANAMESFKAQASSDALGWAQLAQQGRQFDISQGQRGMEFNAAQALQDKLANLTSSSAMDRLVAQGDIQSLLEGQRNQFTSQENILNRASDLERAQLDQTEALKRIYSQYMLLNKMQPPDFKSTLGLPEGSGAPERGAVYVGNKAYPADQWGFGNQYREG
jgi:hypothetical protein